jgi:hypothetical protein
VRLLPLAAALLVSLSVAGCGSSAKDDDGDGMYNSTEDKGWSVSVDRLREHDVYRVTSDTGNFDTDGDGLPDQEEFFLQLDPRKADTDGDGLSDCQEGRHTVRADCERADFTGPFDGGYGTDPVRADSDPGVSAYVLDELDFKDLTGTGYVPQYGDGISDGEEVAGYTITLPSGSTRFVKTDPRNADTDGDRLDDGEERDLYGTDPEGNRDTDGDGCEDGFDPVPEAEESYDFGLQAFTLHRGGRADLALTLLTANEVAHAPPAGTVPVDEDQREDLTGIDPAPIRPTGESCTYTPRDPWVLVQAVVRHDGPTGARNLDISSVKPGAGSADGAAAYWNVRTGELSWSLEGTDPWPASQGLRFQGLDGTLELSPRVLGFTP